MGMKYVAGRRDFIKHTAAMTAGLAGLGRLPEVAAATPDTGVNILGPKPGYSPQVGTMVSMLTWMQDAVVRPVQDERTRSDADRTAELGARRFSRSARRILRRYPLGEIPAQRLNAIEKAASDR
jgi:hypothetical protein